MTRITKRAGRDAGPRAALAKLEDARTLLAEIRQALDNEICARADDIGRPGTGWTHYGDAGRLHEELKNIGELLGVARNEVSDAHACPGCGTRDTDRLLIDESEVRCSICGCHYTLD